MRKIARIYEAMYIEYGKDTEHGCGQCSNFVRGEYHWRDRRQGGEAIEQNKIYYGNAFDVLKMFPDGCINCCVTSPPYFNLRDYGIDGQIGLEESPSAYVKHLVKVFREIKRVLRDDGTLWVNIGDCYAGSGKGAWKHKNKQKETYTPDPDSPQCKNPKVWDGIKPKDLIGIPWLLAFALREDGWWLRQDVIWEKPNCLPESVKDRCTRAHEYIFLFSKSRRYYFDHEAIKEPCVNRDLTSPKGNKGGLTPHSGRRGSGNKERKQRPCQSILKRGSQAGHIPWADKELRNKRSVWHVNTKPLKNMHFATFPETLVLPCILSGCPEGGVVLDPFVGSGTVGVVAKQNNRKYVGIDLNPEYCDMANERIERAWGE